LNTVEKIEIADGIGIFDKKLTLKVMWKFIKWICLPWLQSKNVPKKFWKKKPELTY
jgi:hypothetical protein